jgi:hydroxyacylglutathione hydrolase
LEEALFCCNKALTSNPETPRALQIKALCLTDMGRGEEAIEVLDNILAQQSDNAFALTAKGHALLGLGRYADSLEYFDQALQINPSIHEAQVYKGLALYLSGQPEKAMEIDVFREEFIGRFKEELNKQSQAGEPGDPPDRP